MIDTAFITKFSGEVKKKFAGVQQIEIVEHLLYYILKEKSLEQHIFSLSSAFLLNDSLFNFISNTFPEKLSLENVISVYEGLIDSNQKKNNGITFTPSFIADYICEYALRKSAAGKRVKIIDPSCGGGVFLLRAIKVLKKHYCLSAREIIENNLFGIDIVQDNVLVSKLILLAACILEGTYVTDIKINLLCVDSLQSDWSSLFGSNFDAVVGNPPYVNPHDLDKKVVSFLKHNFSTTSHGTTNIFYAFVEKGMRYVAQNGALCYIVPNNFITINAAGPFRDFLTRNQYISFLVDFTENMLFAPTRTYNAIIGLDHTQKDKLSYIKIPKTPTDQIEDILHISKSETIDYSDLDNEHRWALLTDVEKKNIAAIEGQWSSIKKYIKTGIATLRDGCYLIDEVVNGGFVKRVADTIFYIEPEIVRPIYKVSEITPGVPAEQSKRFIIFPYRKNKAGKQEIIPEKEFKESFPQAYACLFAQKDILDQRDKGKENPAGWYAYGRAQGINFYGKKILYPTFTNFPKFQLVPDPNALFCNGYAIFESEDVPSDVLVKILNSSVMDYYMKMTSYPIEGGYMCYQKKYIERFSIPYLTEADFCFIRENNAQDLINVFLEKKYNLTPCASFIGKKRKRACLGY